MKKFNLSADYDLLNNLPIDTKIEEIVLEKGEISAFDLPHILPSKLHSELEENISVIWLDGSNYFNPYQISRTAKILGVRPEEVLKNTYISRAFTCHQMKSLILERMWKALEEFEPNLIIITGLPSQFSETDDFRGGATKIFEPIEGELEKFRERKEGLLMVTGMEKPGKESEILPRLESISNTILQVENRNGNVKIEIRNKSSSSSKPRREKVPNSAPPGNTTLDRYI